MGQAESNNVPRDQPPFTPCLEYNACLDPQIRETALQSIADQKSGSVTPKGFNPDVIGSSCPNVPPLFICCSRDDFINNLAPFQPPNTPENIKLNNLYRLSCGGMGDTTGPWTPELAQAWAEKTTAARIFDRDYTVAELLQLPPCLPTILLMGTSAGVPDYEWTHPYFSACQTWQTGFFQSPYSYPCLPSYNTPLGKSQLCSGKPCNDTFAQIPNTAFAQCNANQNACVTSPRPTAGGGGCCIGAGNGCPPVWTPDIPHLCNPQVNKLTKTPFDMNTGGTVTPTQDQINSCQSQLAGWKWSCNTQQKRCVLTPTGQYDTQQLCENDPFNPCTQIPSPSNAIDWGIFISFFVLVIFIIVQVSIKKPSPA